MKLRAVKKKLNSQRELARLIKWMRDNPPIPIMLRQPSPPNNLRSISSPSI